VATCAALIVSGAWMLPLTAQAWNYRSFDDSMRETFGEWRALIPPRTDVAWYEAPMSTWYLLQRPSYFSSQQTGSVVFSRAAALETVRREREMLPLLLATGLSNPDSPGILKLEGHRVRAARTLAEVCAATRVRFLVTRTDLHAAPLALAPHGAAPGFRALRLYRCDLQVTAQ